MRDLTSRQKEFVVESYTYIASILRIGDDQEEMAALEMLDTALAIKPDHQWANELKSSILAGHAIYPDNDLPSEDSNVHICIGNFEQNPYSYDEKAKESSGYARCVYWPVS